MEDVLLIEAVERYLTGEMSPQDLVTFEELRKNNPEIDQLVVENIYFLQGIDKYNTIKSFKHTLQEVDTKLTIEGIIAEPVLKGKAKVIGLWTKYKRNIAVAASIAGFISLLTSGLMITYTKKNGNEYYSELVERINQTNKEVSKLKSFKSSTSQSKMEVKADYRATGFLIDGSGYLVTNAHVLNKMKNIYVENSKGEYFTASTIYTDNSVDLAILKITDTAYKTITNLPFSVKRNNADLGEQFFTLGFPRNEIVYGEGYVSAKSGSDGDSTAYQLTVSANPGNSGGPVINRNGELIGVITAKDSKADGVVYAAKAKNIFKLIDQLKKDDNQYHNIKMPTGNELKKLERTQQVKKMEDVVFMVVGSN
jgi:S1-C subfamily serine protease